MPVHVVAKVGDLPPGRRKIVEIDGRSIGVFNVGGRFYALRNTCPHQGAPLCLGSLSGTALPSPPGEYVWGREGEILSCPWHGWEFDITTGRSVFNPHRTRVRSYEVTVHEDTVHEDTGHEDTGHEPDEDDPRIPSFPVTVEDGDVLLHV